jgi:hypothetical protein
MLGGVLVCIYPYNREGRLFEGGPAYLMKTDLDVPVLRKKKMCLPDTVPVTHGSVDPPSSRGVMIQVLSVTQLKHQYWILSWNTIGHLRQCERKRLFSLWTVHLPVSPLSTLWLGVG